MEDRGDFYTLKGYQSKENAALTAAMEDYLEMVCRMAGDTGDVRVGDLSGMLHVKPPSATKMVRQLQDAGYLHAEKYGRISPTEKGRAQGEYLLRRHETLSRFLRFLNHSGDELEQVEKLEHFLDPDTVENLAALTRRLEEENTGAQT